jgi:ABC-type uncharacterized transport system permease subunit
MYMLYTTFMFITVSLYFAAAILQALFLTAKLSGKQIWIFYLGFLAVFSHAWLLYHWIDTGHGQNLTLLNLFSQAAWVVALLQLILAIKKPLENLAIFIFPITGLTIIFADLFPSQKLVDAAADPAGLGHLLLALVAFGVLCIAACQAILVAIQDRQLRHKDTLHALRILPPVESMERLLFQLIGVGFGLLTLLLLSSFYLFEHIFSPPLLSKTLLTILTWLIFATLLAGRLLFGWRSHTAVKWTLSGVIVLLVCYLISEALT